MKRILQLFCFAICSLSMISCASAPDTIPPELEETPLRNRYYREWGGADYRFLDGTKISNMQLETILLEVPGNEKVLRDSKIAFGTAWACLGVWCAATMAEGIYEESWPGAKGIRVAMPIVELLATIGMVSGFSWGAWEKDRAVDNYNLYIQGIPVK